MVATPLIADINLLLPSQMGNSGEFLTTNGTVSSWGTPGAIALSEVWVTTPGAGSAGYGSTSNNHIRRYTVTRTATGTAITYADSSTNGSTFTINENGLYLIVRQEGGTGAGVGTGISVNSNQLTTSVASITSAHQLAYFSGPIASSFGPPYSSAFYLQATDIIRPHDAATFHDGANTLCWFRIIKVRD